MCNIYINELWNNEDQNIWLGALNRYWQFLRPNNIDLENRMNNLNPNEIQIMQVNDFYNFLLNEYFSWKYTAPNRLATTTRQLNRYINENRLNDLQTVKEDLFHFNLNDQNEGLKIASRIHGLGTAGASGLLAIIYPHYFGTVDQFVVKALCEIPNLPENIELNNMNPEGLTIRNGVFLINIMRNKANSLNNLFNTDSWTPRKIDMILWTYGR
jgi:hypothetical protein